VSPAPSDVLVDTSVAVALVVADHTAHVEVRESIGALRLGLSGHAAFETYSVLTRLPAPARRAPATVRHLLEENFPASRFLGSDDAAAVLARLADLGIAGGSVYDALVASTATAFGVPLASRDRRAMETYRAVGADVIAV